MGNKLCAPWKKGYRDDDHPWAPKKDSHLLRLWAEIFEVRDEEGDICWARVSDDVVPVNITCIQDTPETVFQITAYNRHVEKIFDVRLIQPGTRITQASECFVHWKDSRCEHEWGLNFTTPVDARRFRDCCMNPTTNQSGYACKASSSGSLRLSPPKRVRGRKATSNPTSPVSKPRHGISSPEELALQDAIEAGFVPSHGDDTPTDSSGLDGAATVPRKSGRQIPHAQSVFAHDGVQRLGSDSSGYDIIGHQRQYQQNNRHIYENPYETVGRRAPSHPNAASVTMHKPIGERDIPYNQFHQNHNSIYQSSYHTYHPRSRPEGIYAEPKKLIHSSSKDRLLDRSDKSAEHKLSRPELRQFSREPTVIKLSDRARSLDSADDVLVNDVLDYDNLPLSGTDETDLDQVEIQVCAPIEEKGETLSPPRQSLSSSSSDWPPPPDGGISDAITPPTPGLGNASFDSNTLRRMLRSLPDSSPREVRDRQFDFNENVTTSSSQPAQPTSQPPQLPPKQHELQQQPHCQRPSSGSVPVHRSQRKEDMHVQIVENKIPPTGHPNARSEMSRAAENIVTDARPPIGQIKPQRIPLEPASDLQFRANKSRDSYTESVCSGMTSETVGSVKSGDSGRSGRSSKSATLPPGLGLSSFAARSSAGSSGGSSSGHHSDLIKQLGPGSETSEQIRHLATSDIDISESETESSSEDAQESDTSSIHTMPSESQASFASKSAAVRKAGWLTVKNWLIHKKRKIELAPKRSWKKYWVCLKGTVLLFYACDENETVKEDSIPRHMLVIEGGIAQAVPEHPKREHIFALSSAFGDAYLFEATSQIELENWISGIHSACASSFARQHGKENTLRLLRSEIQKSENSIDLDIKMKKMAGMQLTVVTDPKSKAAIEKQIAQWDENLEKLYMEQYRLRCYMASLQGSELPNPKNLLGCASKGTKAILSRIGVFTVTSFHALVCARTPLTTTTYYSKRQKRGLLSTFKADSVTKIRPRSPRPLSGDSSGQAYKNTDVADQVFVDLSTHDEDNNPQVALDAFHNLVRISLPGAQSTMVGISEKMSVGEVLDLSCNKRQLNPNDHFIRLKLPELDNFKIPEKSSLLQTEEYESIEICAKILFQIELNRLEKDKDFGFQVEAELAEDTEKEDELCVFISEVSKGGVAHRKGLIVGDEMLVINSKVIAELDMVYVETMLIEATSIYLTIRSCRIDSPVNTTALMEHADMYIENMMCPPPPTQNRISDKVIGDLIVPAPNWVSAEKNAGEGDGSSQPPGDVALLSSAQIDHLLQGAEQVTHFCRLLHARDPMPETMNTEETFTRSKPLSDSQRIRKVIMELIETERQYVRDLNCLIERYLEPMKEETFLTGEDIEQLFGNIQEIVQFQKLFLQSLEESVELEPNFSILTEPRQFKDDELRRVLFSLGGSFLYYANHFKLYSSFCASHSKAQKLLNPDNNIPLREFLRARNPKQQHSATLESYLIKPIQRILKYPLLLKQLKELTDPQSDEHHHLSEALRGMEAVAEHINEMQKIYEEYGNIFDELIHQCRDAAQREHGKCVDLNVGDLQMYGTVTWLNALDELGKIKKGTDLLTLVFIFKTGVVILAQERIRGKKRPKPQGRPVIDSGDITRFMTVIAVDQLQVKTSVGDTERHGIWELIHCRSEKEGRPEKAFQFASSKEARRDFVKIIHNAIRDSVRRMSIPATKSQQIKTKGHPQSTLPPTCEQQPQQQQQQQQQQPHHQQYLTYSGKRPDSLAMTNQQVASQSMGKKKGKQIKSDMIRHSMEVEEKGRPPDQAAIDFRTRSQTLTDLNNMDLQYCQQGAYPCGSSSTIASESRGSAKLIHASNTPQNYAASAQKPPKERVGSPIWKPRHSSKKATVRSPSEEKALEPSAVFSGSAYGDYSNVVYDDKHSVSLTPPNAATYCEYEDTDC